jgi:hypothetical protein
VPCTNPKCLEGYIEDQDRLANYEEYRSRAAEEKGSLKGEVAKWREQATRMKSVVARMELEIQNKESARAEAEDFNRRLLVELEDRKSEDSLRRELEAENDQLRSQLAAAESLASSWEAKMQQEQDKVHNLRLEHDRLTVALNSNEDLAERDSSITSKTFGIVERQVQDYAESMQAFMKHMRDEVGQMEDHGKMLRDDMSRFQDEHSKICRAVASSIDRNKKFRNRLQSEKTATSTSATVSKSNARLECHVDNRPKPQNLPDTPPSRHSDKEQGEYSPLFVPEQDYEESNVQQAAGAPEISITTPKTGRRSNIVLKRGPSYSGESENTVKRVKVHIEDAQISPTIPGSIDRSRDPRLQNRSGTG